MAKKSSTIGVRNKHPNCAGLISPQAAADENLLSSFQIEARINTRKAAAMGFRISLENIEGHECLCWQGSDPLFAQAGIFKNNFDFSSIKKARWVHPQGLRGNLLRQKNGDLKFAIRFCHLSALPISYMRKVKTDEAFKRFKERCLAPLEGQQIDSQ